MTNAETAERVLKTFDINRLYELVHQADYFWLLPHYRVPHAPSRREIAREATALLLALLDGPPDVTALSRNGLLVTRRGSRVGIAFCPIRSEEFP